jgi:hypothetical protein
MPIRLNLLAEAQAQEELRRKDPVKRAIWIGSLLVTCMLVWASSVYFKSLLAKHALSQVEAQIGSHTNEYNIVVANQRKSDELKKKLGSLRQLATSRFLQGNLLEGLQHVYVEDVQLTRIKVDQIYVPVEEVKPKTNSEGRVTMGKPATVTESILVTLEAKDSTPKPGEVGDQVPKFREALSTNAYFRSVLSRTNAVKLTYISGETVQPDARPFKLFTIECRYPDQTR